MRNFNLSSEAFICIRPDVHTSCTSDFNILIYLKDIHICDRDGLENMSLNYVTQKINMFSSAPILIKFQLTQFEMCFNLFPPIFDCFLLLQA